MVLRNVAKTFSLEEQRQEINEIAVDLDAVNTTLTNWNASQWDTAYGWGDHAQAGYWVDNSTSRTNWDTAYGWGDHGSAGYWVEDSVKITNWDTAYGWGDHGAAGYLVATSASYNNANWDTAYGWGDHGAVGYLTSYTESDPVFGASAASGIAAADITNWDTAYGWGDHGTAGYAASGDILTPGGTSSGSGTAQDPAIGSVQFKGPSNTFGGDSTLVYDNTNNRFGIGDDNPDVQLNVKGSGTSFAGQNTHVKIEDTTSLAANTGGLLAFEGVYNSSGNPGAFAMIHGGKDNADDGNYAGYLRFFTRTNGSLPAERLRINAVGELLIGESSSPLDESITGATACKIGMSFGNSTGNYIEMGGTNRNANGLSKLAIMRHGYWGGSREVGSLGFLTSSSSGGAGRGSANFVVYTGTSGNGDGGTSGDALSIERTRVDSGGAFYVNTSSNNNWTQTDNTENNDNANTNDFSGNLCFRTSQGTLVLSNDADSGYSGMYMNKWNWQSGDDDRWINFYLNGGSQDSIRWNGSNIVYGTNSDYRIKTNIRDFTGGIDALKELRVRKFDYIDTERGTDHVGFIAHELQEVVPEAVTGEKDGMRIEEETGNEVMNVQSVDYGKLTPLLAAALQEALAEIETLKGRLDAAGL